MDDAPSKAAPGEGASPAIHPADLTIAEAGAAFRSGMLTSVALTEAHLDRIARHDASIRAFVHVAGDAAIAAARSADRMLAVGQDLGPLIFARDCKEP